MDCIFCKIVSGEIPSKKVYEDEKILAFYDLDPQAKVHVLVIPKEHISCVDDINESNSKTVAYIFEKIPVLMVWRRRRNMLLSSAISECRKAVSELE